MLKKTLENSKAIAIVTTALFFASLLWITNTSRLNNSLKKRLESEKLKSEELLSEKLLLEKSIIKIKSQLFNLQDRNLDLDNVVKNTRIIADTQKAEYKRMKKMNFAFGQLENQRNELLSIQNQLENELQAVKFTYAELVDKNNELLNTVTFLQERNLLLTNDLKRSMFVTLDQSQIQAVKGKGEKLTICAKKTQKLIANFEVQADLKNIAFRIVDPKGNVLSAKDGSIASTTTPSARSLTASSNPEVHGTKLQKIEMMFFPNEKLKAGIYTVEVLNANQYVGNLKVKLK